MTNTREQADMTDTPITHPLSPRLRELSDAVTQGREAMAREFTMRVPAEPNRDADLVLSRAAYFLDRQAAEIALLREEVTAGVSSLGYAMDTVHKADQEIARLRAEVEALRSLLSEAADDIADWGAYAGEYFQQKHDLAGNVEKYRDAARTPEGRSDG